MVKLCMKACIYSIAYVHCMYPIACRLLQNKNLLHPPNPPTASRIPPGRIDWVVGGRVVFFVLVVFSVFYVFVGLVAVLGCLLVVWLLGCWFEQPNNPKKQPPNNPIIRQPSYQTTQEHNNPTTQTNRFPTKKSKRQTTKNIRKLSHGDPKWSQNLPKVEPKSKKVR